ncbi:MAG TPA: HIT domain-containing protein, partial [Thermoguttaceae bacterium]|nr:HIT domain-containing protein [Thermoguttaceae bacterium]
QHLVSTSELAEEQIREVLWVYRDRLVDLKKDPRLVHGMLFKNVGAAAGASLEHIHSQLIATPFVPIAVWEEMTGSLEFYHSRGRCVFCEILGQELADRRRMVLDAPGFVAFCPFAGRSPFETWIVPKTHGSHYENLSENQLDELSGVLRRVVGKMESALGRPAYNYIIHTAPFDTPELGHYHWHIEIMPSVTKAAGFEWGTGFYINPVRPEDAASILAQSDPEIRE